MDFPQAENITKSLAAPEEQVEGEETHLAPERKLEPKKIFERCISKLRCNRYVIIDHAVEMACKFAAMEQV